IEDVDASYLIVADGTGGPVRQQLGIERHGPGALQSWMNVIFEADLEPVLAGRRYTSAFITDINGTFVPREDGNRWLMAVPYRPANGERADDFDDRRCIDLIRKGAGRPDLDITIVDARPWDAAAFVADSYRKGRAFLVGDTAHVMPPTGGFGGNTGIHDAFGLAWKLDTVLRNVAGEALLDTYERERQRVAERTLAQALARLQSWFKDPDNTLPPPEPIVDDAAVVFGYRYAEGAIVPEASDEGNGDDVFEDPRTPTGRPGTRAAQLIVEYRGARVSTIDLFFGKWVLLTGADGGGWIEAARRAPSTAASGLHCFAFGPRGNVIDVDKRWSSKYGVGQSGATLIRPDGFVAWRANEARSDAVDVMRDAIERLTFKSTDAAIA
ncbi:MAG TPA: FAD-dependent monooxygenase, partial [Gemmatimonadaceae bacterium]|nr:FAD-dependent monooxygenase [Gemmatimonadaceae bacterium]